MARIRWDGKVFNAEPVRQLPNGNWIMRAQAHGARYSVGTEIEVAASEIVEMTPYSLEQRNTMTIEQLNAAMAAERETLPSPQSVIAANPPIAHDAPDKVVSVPTGPTQRP